MASFSLFLLLVALAAAQTSTPTYLITYQYSSVPGNCAGGPLVQRSVRTSCANPGGPLSACVSNQNTRCVSGVPASFTGSVYLTTHSNAQCTDQPLEALGWSNNLCVQFGADSYTAFCSGSTMALLYFTTNNLCRGQAYYATYEGNVCTPLASQSFPPGIGNITGTYGFATCTGLCFHETTELQYERDGHAMTMTLAELESKKHSEECHVPHTIRASGVAIHTTCSATPLRLTNDHLVYSSTGLRRASSVQAGDIVYRDLAETKLCTVTKVEGETNQRYFALNCKKSDVLANGIKTSLFGNTHSIPAAWMKYATRIMSVEHASTIGDGLVALLHKFNIVP